MTITANWSKLPYMSMTSTAIKDAAVEAAARIPGALRALRGYYQVSNGKVAEAMGRPGPTGTNWVQAHMNGDSGFSGKDIWAFAKVFGVDTDVLYMETDDEVYAWLISHAHDCELRPKSGWFTADEVRCDPVVAAA